MDHIINRLKDVENCDGRIHLVFECIDMTLTQYLLNANKMGGMPIEDVKVFFCHGGKI